MTARPAAKPSPYFFPTFEKIAVSARADIFVEVVGRHSVEWCTNKLASILAHELVGHRVEHQRAR
ncbi:hypothetical protein OAS67_08665 [Alphaproteobacteria bacterium]|nr:hypothetical protein [Alphaproteobacteria bacterium]